MRIHAVWWVGLIVFLIYNLIIYVTWFAVGADYTNLIAHDLIAKSVVLPLALGALFLAAVLTYLGWWHLVLFEDLRAGPGWTLWVVIAVMLGFTILHNSATNWSAISSSHLMFLVAVGILVGFNEEALTRGILVVGFRGSNYGEVAVWFWSSLLFGLLHLPNTLFGLPLYAAIAQVGFAFLAGSGFYLLRRVGGTLLIPMLMHGAWDFATFSSQASGSEPASLVPIFQFGTYLLSIALVIVVLRHSQHTEQH